jgi:hypothetical protein
MTTIDQVDWDTCERERVREELIRIARLLDTVIIPHLQDHPDDEWAQLVMGQLASVKTALELLAREQ